MVVLGWDLQCRERWEGLELAGLGWRCCWQGGCFGFELVRERGDDDDGGGDGDGVVDSGDDRDG